MDIEACVIDADSLRENLMAPSPMQRAIALHALEVQLARETCAASKALANEVTQFAARGMPFYCPHDPHYRQWVGKAVSYWQRLR